MLTEAEKIKNMKSSLSEFDLRSLNLADFSADKELRFHEYMKGICRRLLGDTLDLDDHNILFALSDKNETNAAHAPKENVTVIYITESLLDLCRNEDQLAFILGHELGHFEERLRQGDNKQNSQAEETACDLRAIQKMARGGYNLEEAYNIAADLFNNYHIDIEDLRDPHTNDTSRVNLIKAMKIKERDRIIEEQNVEITQSTPVPADIRIMVRNRVKQPSLFEILDSQLDEIHGKYDDLDNENYENEITDTWLKSFHEHIISNGAFYDMTEEDIEAFAHCFDIYFRGKEDKFLAAVFSDFEAIRNTDKYVACVAAMHNVLHKIVSDSDFHSVEADEKDGKTAAWLKHYLHGFREAEGQQFDEIINNLEYVKKFVAEPDWSHYRGIYVKNFNILELEFNENDTGKKISPHALNYIKENIDEKGNFLTFSGLKADKIGDSLLLTNEDKNWSFLVNPSGEITHSFSTQDLAQTQILSAENTIESIPANIEAVAEGKITDISQRLSILREAHKVVSAVLYSNDLNNVINFGDQYKNNIVFTEVANVLSPQAKELFNERTAQTNDNLVYTDKITDLYATAIRAAPKEYFTEVWNNLLKSDISHRLSGEDKLLRAFLDNPTFSEELSQIIESYEPFPEKSAGWDTDNMSEYDDSDMRRRLLNTIDKIKEITDFKLAEHIEHGGTFDDFEQPFKKDLAKLFGFAPQGNLDDHTMLKNLQETYHSDYKPITLYEKAYVAYSSYDVLKSNDATSAEFLMGYNGAGIYLRKKCSDMDVYVKSPEEYGISAAEQKQIQQIQQKLLTVTEQIHDKLRQRLNNAIKDSVFSAYDICSMTIVNDSYKCKVYKEKGFDTLIANKDFEEEILRHIETSSYGDVHMGVCALANILEEYGNTKESDAYKEKIWPSLKKLFARDDITVPQKTRTMSELTYRNIFASDYKRYYEVLIGKDGKSGLLKEIADLEDDYAKFECYEELLDRYSRIPDPEIRADVIKNAALSCWKIYSQYNDITDSDDYERDLLIERINKIKDSYIPELDKIEFLKELSELTLSQKELSLIMKPDAIDVQVSDQKAINAAYGLDLVAYVWQNYPESKINFQDFLLGEGTSQEAEALTKNLQLTACKEHDKHYQPKVSERYLNGEDISNELTLKERFCFDKLNSQNCLHFKREFDAAPLEIKALIVNEMITNGESDWEQSFKTVSDKLFADAGELGKVGSDFLHSYIAARPNSEKTFYLAAMMAAANNKSKSSPNYKNSPYSPEERNLAKGLRLFLENSGPAGTKLAQAMSSYSEVPEFIRYEMQFAKSEASPPARWEIFSGNDEAMDKLLQYGALGKRRGSASFFVTYDLGDKIVKIMRRGAKLKADNEFAIYTEMLQTLSAEYQNISSFKRLIKNAAENVHIETDLEIGEQQYKDAKKLYPENVTANDITFKIQVMDWVARDENWAILDKAQGVDFKELDEPYKTAAAKAVFSTEMANMLSGKRFDSDRHGGQYKFDTQNNVIGVFDTGSMSMTEPTDKDRQALGIVLARTLNDMRRNQNVASLFSNEIDKITNEFYARESTVPPYLSEFQRGMLALNDFYSQLSFKDMAECVFKAMDNGKNQIHPQIVSAFKKEISDILKANNVSVNSLLRPEDSDKLAPEARANRRIGKVLFNSVFKEQKIDFSAATAQKLLSLLNNNDSDLQIVKGVIRGAHDKIDPQKYPQAEREELGAFLYKICCKDCHNQILKKDQSLEDVISLVTANTSQKNTYIQNVVKLVRLMSKIPGLNDNLLKRAAVFIAFTDKDVTAGFKNALKEDKNISLAKRMLLKLTPLEFIPNNGRKTLIKTISKHFIKNLVSKQLQISPQAARSQAANTGITLN